MSRPRQSWPPGWRKISRKVWPTSPFQPRINAGCALAHRRNESTWNSNVAPAWRVCFPTKLSCCASSARSWPKPVKNGKPENLPQHGKPQPSPQFKMLKHFTEKNLRRPLVGVSSSIPILRQYVQCFDFNWPRFPGTCSWKIDFDCTEAIHEIRCNHSVNTLNTVRIKPRSIKHN